MTTTIKNLAEMVVLLPVNERAYLAERLVASLEETDAEQKWITQAKRRRDEVRSGRVKPISAKEVYRRIDSLLKR